MGVIDEVRKEREDLAGVLVKYPGIRKSFENAYPDSAHFIYELLQNAEDCRAKNVNFQLTHDWLVFEHDGDPFSLDDIYEITKYGEGTKTDNQVAIGGKGIGFKAVFAYSETPSIWSPTYSFKLEGIVLPYELTSKLELKDKTRFEFPFNNPKKPKEEAFEQIKKGLNELAETTLLFLANIEFIKWQIGVEVYGEVQRIKREKGHIEVLKQIGGKSTSAAHFLKFEKVVTEEAYQNVAVAFELEKLPDIQGFDNTKPIAKQLKITPVQPGSVSVYFPAPKETSGLRFHVHGSFDTELSRASIVDTDANLPLYELIAELIASSLHKIRDLGLLTTEFLGVLPNNDDDIPPRYEKIRGSIIEEMKAQPLTPTQSGRHQPAKYLRSANATLKNVLSDGDLQFLIGKTDVPVFWVKAAQQKSSRSDKFLDSLGIEEWDSEEFIDLIKDKLDEPWPTFVPDKQILEWLASKPIEWHQKFYAHLYIEAEKIYSGFDGLEKCRIVRLETGAGDPVMYGQGDESFFPIEGVTIGNFQLVDASTYSTGKNATEKIARTANWC